MNKTQKQVKKLIRTGYTSGRQVFLGLNYRLQARKVSINPTPILVLGNQKSGTSAIAALLAELTGASVAIDLWKEIRNPTYHRILQGDLTFDQFVENHRLEFSKQIVKEPNLTLLYPELRQRFPDSQYVFVVRDPVDNIRSILNRLKIPGNLKHVDYEQFKQVTPAWKLIIDNHWLGLGGDQYIEMLAARWSWTANVYLKHPNQMILVKYEDFLKDKAGELARLANTLGLKPTNDISHLLDKQFQPKGNRSVDRHTFFGEENLNLIETICRESMNEFGY